MDRQMTMRLRKIEERTMFRPKVYRLKTANTFNGTNAAANVMRKG
jgi:hypothetical protein